MVSAWLALALAAAPQDCRQAYEQVRYRDAIAACTEAITTASKDQLAELYRMLGLSLASQGDHARAKAAFVSLLAVDPAATLSDSYSPKLRADFEAARAAGAGTPVTLGIQPPAPARVGVPLEVLVKVEDGAAKPVTEVQLRAAGTHVTLPRDGPLRATLPASAEPGPRPVTLSAFDGFGGRLGEQQLSFDVTAVPRRPLVLSWVAWSVLTIAAGGAGATLGVLSRNDGTQARTTMLGDSSYALEQRANSEAIAADACLAAAGAFGITALILFLTR